MDTDKGDYHHVEPAEAAQPPGDGTGSSGDDDPMDPALESTPAAAAAQAAVPPPALAPVLPYITSLTLFPLPLPSPLSLVPGAAHPSRVSSLPPHPFLAGPSKCIPWEEIEGWRRSLVGLAWVVLVCPRFICLAK